MKGFAAADAVEGLSTILVDSLRMPQDSHRGDAGGRERQRGRAKERLGVVAGGMADGSQAPDEALVGEA